MQAPPIDTRDNKALVEETTTLAQQLSGWRPRADGQSDAGSALIRVFGHFAELVVQRINRAPEKNYLAFLNLIGTQMLPPQPARVPITFTLAEGSPVDALVPAGTQVAAPPLEGEDDEVVFETERNLVVTRAQLQAVFVGDPETDKFSDRTAEATGTRDQPYAAFDGDTPIAHQLFIACDSVLAQPGAKDITLILQSPDTLQWTNWAIEWAYWDGKAKAWQPVKTSATVANGTWRVVFSQLPECAKTTVNGIEAGWLRAQLDLALSPSVSNAAPDSIAIGNRRPEDFALPIAPFGETKDGAVKFFYFSADEALASGNARARLNISLARAGSGANVKLNWAYRVGSEWRLLGSSSAKAASTGASDFGFTDGTQAFTRDGEIGFNVPAAWPREFLRSRIGRWLRVEVTDDGAYTALPQIKTFGVSYGWDLPRMGGITVQLNESQVPAGQKPGTTVPKVLSESAFFNNGVVDLTKDFYPFGEQPHFNDTLYLSLPDAQAQPESVITMLVEVSDPAKATTDPAKTAYAAGKPQIVWEVSDGNTWHEMGRFTFGGPVPAQSPSDGSNAFTANGSILLTLPKTMSPTTVNSEERVWLRARLVSGDYGKAATYAINGKDAQNRPIYDLVAATFAPPSIKSLSFKPVAVRSTVSTAMPASAATGGSPVLCQSYNDFTYQDDSVPLSKGQAFVPFTPTSDPDPALYLGFDQPFDARLISLYLQVEPPLPEEVAADELAELDTTTLAQVIWEYASADGWRPLGAIDETQTLASRGLVQFSAPQNFVRRACFGQSLFWVRARWQRGYFPIPPRLRRVLPNTMWAAQVATIANEILGLGNGNPNQSFITSQQPVQPGQQVLVREREQPTVTEARAVMQLEGADAITVTHDAAGQPEDIWVRWHAVADFYGSDPRDRHYTVDALTGEVRFGDGQFGLVPPQGQNNIRVAYKTGGGEQGNRATETIVQLKSGVPYIDGATNHEPAQGGAAREPIERLKARGPRVLRHRNRVIAAQDIEDLAYEASSDVARAAAVLPWFDPTNLWLDPKTAPTEGHIKVDAGRMGVIVVPNTDATRPTPSLGLLRVVQAHLVERCPSTADVWVAGPEWVRVTVKATVVPIALDQADAVAERVRTTLAGYLHPLSGGPKGEGWAFGRKPHRSDVYALVEGVAGVDHIRVLEIDHAPEAADANFVLVVKRMLEQSLAEASKQPPAPELVRWLNRALVYSGEHEITVALLTP